MILAVARAFGGFVASCQLSVAGREQKRELRRPILDRLRPEDEIEYEYDFRNDCEERASSDRT
jgi:hypothetical protein